jgi:hypothetical protein
MKPNNNIKPLSKKYEFENYSKGLVTEFKIGDYVIRAVKTNSNPDTQTVSVKYKTNQIHISTDDILRDLRLSCKPNVENGIHRPTYTLSRYDIERIYHYLKFGKLI